MSDEGFCTYDLMQAVNKKKPSCMFGSPDAHTSINILEVRCNKLSPERPAPQGRCSLHISNVPQQGGGMHLQQIHVPGECVFG